MLLSNFATLAAAPGGVARLRELILTLAVQGKLLPQDPADEPASELLKKIRAEKDRLIAEGKIKRDKPLAGIAEAEQPFELPQGWEWVRIADLAFPQAGFAFKSGAFNEIRQGLPLIRIRDVGDNDPATYYSGDYREEFIVEPGEWLISMDGEFRVRQWTGPSALLNQRVTRLMFYGADLFQPFVTAALQFKLNELQGTKAYTTVDHLSGGQIASSVIALPPLAEQSRIVARVEELMRLCDALQDKARLEATQHDRLVSTLLATLTDSASPEALAENWQRLAIHFDTLIDRPEAVDALEQTILQLAVRGQLVPQDPADEPASELLKHIRSEKDRLIAADQIKRDKPLPPIEDDEKPFELPQGWEWVRFGEIAGIERGGSPRPIEAFLTDDPTGLNWIKIGDTEKGGKYITSASQKIKREGLVKTRMVFPGDFLLTNSMSFGRPYITQIQGCIHDGWLRISPPDSLDKDFLYTLLSSRFVRNVFEAAAAGGVVLNLNADKVRTVPIPLPPLAEQARIVARVETLRRLCADLRQRLSVSQTTQAKLAEALVESQTA